MEISAYQRTLEKSISAVTSVTGARIMSRAEAQEKKIKGALAPALELFFEIESAPKPWKNSFSFRGSLNLNENIYRILSGK